MRFEKIIRQIRSIFLSMKSWVLSARNGFSMVVETKKLMKSSSYSIASTISMQIHELQHLEYLTYVLICIILGAKMELDFKTSNHFSVNILISLLVMLILLSLSKKLIPIMMESLIKTISAQSKNYSSWLGRWMTEVGTFFCYFF